MEDASPHEDEDIGVEANTYCRRYLCEYEEIPSERWFGPLGLSFSPDRSSSSGSCGSSDENNNDAGFPSLPSWKSSKNKTNGRFQLWRRRKKPSEMDTFSKYPFFENLKRFSYKELRTMTNGFRHQMVIYSDYAQRSFKGLHTDGTNLLVTRYDDWQCFLTELQAFSMFRHENILTCVGWCSEDDNHLIVFEDTPNGTLSSHLHSERKMLPWYARYKVAVDLAYAILHLHECNQTVVHRSIKSSTIRLDSDYNVKLATFVFAIVLEQDEGYEDKNNIVGTMGYLDPQYLISGIATKESDVFCFGVVLLELVTGLPAILRESYAASVGMQTGSSAALFQWTCEMYTRGAISEIIDKKFNGEFSKLQMERLLLTGLYCTQIDCQSRPTMQEVIQLLRLGDPDAINSPEANTKHSSALPSMGDEDPILDASQVTQLMEENQSSIRMFSLEELRSATNSFCHEEIIWIGGSGIIYHGYFTEMNMHVAIKMMYITPIAKRKLLFLEEIKTLGFLRHQNVVQLLGYCIASDEYFIIYELVEKGNLFSFLHSKEKFIPWNIRYNISKGLANAIFYLHEGHGICHTDIASSNVILDMDYMVKLTSFEASTSAGQSTKTEMQRSPGYLDPEFLQTANFTKASDIYSFGIVILEMACGKMAISMDDKGMRVHLFDRVWDLFTRGVTTEAADKNLCMEFDTREMEKLLLLGLSCAQRNSSMRPSILQVIRALNSEECLTQLLCRDSGCSSSSIEKPLENPEMPHRDRVMESSSSCVHNYDEAKFAHDGENHPLFVEPVHEKKPIFDQVSEFQDRSTDRLVENIEKAILTTECFDIGIPLEYNSSGSLEEFQIPVIQGYMSGIHKKLLMGAQFDEMINTIRMFTTAVMILKVPLDEWFSTAQYVLRALRVIQDMKSRHAMEARVHSGSLLVLEGKIKQYVTNIAEDDLELVNSNIKLTSIKEEHALLVKQSDELQKQLMELQEKIRDVRNRWISLEDAAQQIEMRRMQHVEDLEKMKIDYSIVIAYDLMLSKVVSFSSH